MRIIRGHVRYALVNSLAATCILLASLAQASELSERETSLGLADLQGGRTEQALAHFRLAISHEPHDADAQILAGTALAQLARWDEARQAFAQALRDAPSSAEAALGLGHSYFQLGAFQDALAPLQRAIDASDPFPSHARAHLLFGQSLLRLERPEEARIHFESALGANDATATTARFYLGVAQHRLGEASAREHFEVVRREAPGTPLASEAEAYLESSEATQQAAANDTEPKRWHFGGALGLEYDSNPGLITRSSIFGPGLVLDEQGDFRAVLDVSANYALVRDKELAVDVGYGFLQTLHFELEENDLQNHRLALAVAAGKNRFHYGMFAAYDFYLQDSASLVHQATARPWVAFAEPGYGYTELYYQTQLRDYLPDAYAALNGTNHALGIRWSTEPFGPRALLTFGYQFDREDIGDAGNRPFAYRGHQGEFRLHTVVGEAALLELGYRYRDEDFDPAPSRRQDEEQIVDLVLRRALIDQLWLIAAYRAQLNSSTETLFDYDRQIVTLGLEYRP